MPSVIAFRNKPPETILDYFPSWTSKTGRSSKQETFKEILTPNETDEKGYKTFKKYPEIASFLQDERGVKYLERYLVDFQDVKMSNFLIFWRQTITFRTLPNKAYLPGKACILYQKFIIPNAYLYIDCFTEEQREKIKVIVDMVMQDEEAKGNVDPTLFDDMLDCVEQVMLTELFIPFFQSKFYDIYLEKGRLDTGIIKVEKEKVQNNVVIDTAILSANTDDNSSNSIEMSTNLVSSTNLEDSEASLPNTEEVQNS